MGVFDFLTESKPGKMTQVTGTKLGPEAQSIWQSLFPQIKSQQMPTAWAGPTVAGFDPATVAGQEQVLGAAGDAQNLATAGSAAQKYFLDPTRLDVTNDPNIQRQAAAATAFGTQNAQDSLRNVRGESISGNGMYGAGSRGQLREGAAYGNLATGNEKIVADLFANAYQQAAGRQQQAIAQNDAFMRAGATPGAMMDAVVQQREAKAQQELDAQIAQYYQPALLQQAWIMQQLQQLGLMPGATTTSRATGTNPQGSLLGQILGAAAQGGAKMAAAG